MNCPNCGGATKVTDSRPDCEGVYRKRKCLECNYLFYTSEYESDGSDFNRVVRDYIHNKKHNKNYNKN